MPLAAARPEKDYDPVGEMQIARRESLAGLLPSKAKINMAAATIPAVPQQFRSPAPGGL
jgi:hypothetical protein